jgi:hypothetical protein
MTFAGYLFTAIIRPRFSAPLGALAVARLLAWALSAQALVRQIAAHAPTSMSFSEAVKASKDGEVYVRMTGATPDCSRVLEWSFGQAVALADAQGEVAAVGHFDECPPGGGAPVRRAAERRVAGMADARPRPRDDGRALVVLLITPTNTSSFTCCPAAHSSSSASRWPSRTSSRRTRPTCRRWPRACCRPNRRERDPLSRPQTRP